MIAAVSSSGTQKMRDKQFVFAVGSRVSLEAVMPMHESVKCRIVGRDKAAKGMPVFK